MSYYYSYYLGYMDSDRLIYPLGHFDYEGKYHSVLTRSRSFASDLHEMFYRVEDGQMSDRLKAEFTYTSFDGEEESVPLKMLPLNKLPNGSFIKRGFFLIDDVEAYEAICNEDGEPFDTWDLFFDVVPPETYSMRLKNEITLGRPSQEFDVEGVEITKRPCADYTYYAYPDYISKEYESSLIRAATEAYEYTVSRLGDSAEIVVLETEG